MTFPNEDPDQYNATFKYRLEERHESRWVNFENTEGLGFAIQSNQDKGYVFVSVNFVKKGAVALLIMEVSPAIVSSSNKATTKRKVRSPK